MPADNKPSCSDRTKEYLRLLGQEERRLRGFILSLVPNWADADDIAQEVRIRLWEQFHTFQPGGDFGAWARSIAYYEVLTFRRKQARRREVLSTDSLEAIAKEVALMSDELDAAIQALKDCFEKLPQAKRELLMQYYAGASSTREIAAAMGRSFDATRQAILRTRLALRDCVEKALQRNKKA